MYSMCFRVVRRQLHICLYDWNQYRSEAWNLVAGSRPDWLSLVNKRGCSPLMLAVMYGAELEMVRALAILSCALPLCDNLGNTALHYAAHFGRLDLVDAMLLEPTEQEYYLILAFLHENPYGEPLAALDHCQVLAGHREAVAQLLSTRNAMGETPLYAAVKSSNSEVADRLLTMRADPRIEVRLTQFHLLHKFLTSTYSTTAHCMQMQWCAHLIDYNGVYCCFRELRWQFLCNCSAYPNLLVLRLRLFHFFGSDSVFPLLSVFP